MLITYYGSNSFVIAQEAETHLSLANPIDRVTLEAPTLNDLYTAVNALPLEGTWRSINVLSLENLPNTQEVIDLISEAATEIILVFTVKDFAGKQHIADHLRREGKSKQIGNFDRQDMVKYLDDMLYDRGLKMLNKEDRDLFLFLIGDSCQGLCQELDTLREVGVESITSHDFKHITRHSDLNLYNVVNGIFTRDKTVYANLRQYPDTERLINTLAYVVRQAIIVKGAIVVRANISDYAVNKIRRYLRNTSLESLCTLYADMIKLQYAYSLTLTDKNNAITAALLKFRGDITT